MFSAAKRKRAYSCIASLLATAFMVGCKTTSESQTKTDLGPSGNTAVVEQFKRYQGKTNHCNETGTGTRIMLTGFGLFSSPPRNYYGRPYNISGLVTRFMADPSVFPATINTATSAPSYAVTNRLYASYSHVPASAYGGHTFQRELIIDQKPVTVCFVILDVIWDQAAAIILYEASRFKPDRIIMSGLNGGEMKFGLFEAGAVNNASPSVGYRPDGSVATENRPLPTPQGEPPILDPTQAGVEASIAMTWDAKNLATLTLPIAQRIPTTSFGHKFSVRGEDAARVSNDYICNNVSYVILHAAKGTTVDLAGGKLRLGPASAQPAAGSDIEFVALDAAVMSQIKSAGFFHYPDTRTDRGNTVFGWSLVLAKAMVAGL